MAKGRSGARGANVTKIKRHGTVTTRKPVAAAELCGPLTDVRSVLVIVAFTFAVFLPALSNDFVDWDDNEMFKDNIAYRGLGWTHLRWMFTTFHTGIYQPLSWLTLGVDYSFWGMNPFGYHFTNLVFHALTAVGFYFVAQQLLTVGRREQPDKTGIRLGALFAALIFALHPLRVESVAWATERRDVLSGLFFVTAILAYFLTQQTQKPYGIWYWVTLLLAAGAMLAKPIAVTLPVLLLILDYFPLGRLGGERKWNSEATIKVFLEKLPFFAVSAVLSYVGFIASVLGGARESLEVLSVFERATISVYGLWFYFWKTIAPFGLVPLYQLPDSAALAGLSYTFSYVIVLLALVLIIVARRCFPAVAVAAAAYFVTLLPVLGIFHNGPQIVADRYSYLSCMPWAILAGAGVQFAWQAWISGILRKPLFGLAATTTAAVILGLALLTWRQVQVWRDSETLWRYAIQTMPSGIPHYNLAVFLSRAGRLNEAEAHFEKAIDFTPTYTMAHVNLAKLMENRGALTEAMYHLRAAALVEPKNVGILEALGSVFAKQGLMNDAVATLQQAVLLDPSGAVIRFNLGNLLVRQGRLSEAQAQYEAAITLRSDFAEAYYNLGRVQAAQGDLAKAIKNFDAALKIRPDFSAARESLRQALAEQNKAF